MIKIPCYFLKPVVWCVRVKKKWEWFAISHCVRNPLPLSIFGITESLTLDLYLDFFLERLNVRRLFLGQERNNGVAFIGFVTNILRKILFQIPLIARKINGYLFIGYESITSLFS